MARQLHLLVVVLSALALLLLGTVSPASARGANSDRFFAYDIVNACNGNETITVSGTVHFVEKSRSDGEFDLFSTGT